eukprot:SAG25_NODE_20_length_23237_cov_58.179229_8_plen_96_part_00
MMTGGIGAVLATRRQHGCQLERRQAVPLPRKRQLADPERQHRRRRATRGLDGGGVGLMGARNPGVGGSASRCGRARRTAGSGWGGPRSRPACSGI